jgi:hypothetical protein
MSCKQLEKTMTIRKLERSEWQSFCLYASAWTLGKRARIEAISPEIGRQVETSLLPIIGIEYDPRSDVLEVLLVDLDHLIAHPRDLYVDDEPAGLSSFEVIDSEGRRQIVMLYEPLMLPAPAVT